MYIPKILPLSDKFFSFSLQENQFHIFVLLLPPPGDIDIHENTNHGRLPLASVPQCFP